MSLDFKKTPMCEVCGERQAISFSQLADRKWKFTCMCTADDELYYVDLERFFASTSTVVNWLAHLHGKAGMDWVDFMGMMDRFREATGSYGID